MFLGLILGRKPWFDPFRPHLPPHNINIVGKLWILAFIWRWAIEIWSILQAVRILLTSWDIRIMHSYLHSVIYVSMYSTSSTHWIHSELLIIILWHISALISGPIFIDFRTFKTLLLMNRNIVTESYQALPSCLREVPDPTKHNDQDPTKKLKADFTSEEQTRGSTH